MDEETKKPHLVESDGFCSEIALLKRANYTKNRVFWRTLWNHPYTGRDQEPPQVRAEGLIQMYPAA